MVSSIFQAKSYYATKSIISYHLTFPKCSGMATERNQILQHDTSPLPHTISLYLYLTESLHLFQNIRMVLSPTLIRHCYAFTYMLTPLLHSPSVDILFILFECVSNVMFSVGVSLVSHPSFSEGISSPSFSTPYPCTSFPCPRVVLLNIMASILHIFP